MPAKRFFILYPVLFSMFAATTITAEEKAGISALDSIKTEPVTIGYSFPLHSDIMNEDRFIQVCLPGDYKTSGNRYPVLYIVDGQWHFNHATQAYGTLSDRFIPPLILVSVHTLEQRTRDLLPPVSDGNGTGGEADKFLKFMTDELAPFIEKNYRTLPYRALFGSSFGGVFVMHALTSNPAFYNAYMATSPSMWWNNGIMLKRTEQLIRENPNLHNRLYITVANEGEGMGVGELARLLKKYAPKNFKWKFDEYPDELHETVSYKGMYDGLKFIFKDWSPEPVQFIVDGDLVSPGDEVTVKMESKSAIIHYTLDGSIPTQDSPVFEKSLTITEPAVINASPLYDMGLPGKSAELTIQKVLKLEAETVLPELKAGLAYMYYEGNWDSMPDFTQLQPAAAGIAQNFNLSERTKEAMFALQFTGFFDAPKDDLYTFYLTSDDGSQLLMGNQLIIDNDGLHGMVEKSGKVYLKKGKHKTNVRFFQKGGGYGLSLAYETEKFKKTEIPASVFKQNIGEM